MHDVFIAAIIFFAIFHILKNFTDFLLKRKLINTGHVEKAEILAQPEKSKEDNRYPTLKWGLITLFTGAGFIIIELYRNFSGLSFMDFNRSFFPLGILLVFVAAGFLTYFFIVSRKTS